MFTITNNSGHLIASAAHLQILREFLIATIDGEIQSAEITETAVVAVTSDSVHNFALGGIGWRVNHFLKARGATRAALEKLKEDKWLFPSEQEPTAGEDIPAGAPVHIKDGRYFKIHWLSPYTETGFCQGCQKTRDNVDNSRGLCESCAEYYEGKATK